MAEEHVPDYALSQVLEAHDFTGELSLVGKGAFGRVYFAKKNDGSTVAIKQCIQLEAVFSSRATLREIQALRAFDHENIIRLIAVYGIYDGPLVTSVALVLEPMDFSLHDAIYRLEEGLTMPQVEYIVYCVARALVYMHSGDMVHRDLKPANILLRAGSFDVKLCDFGLTRFISSVEPEFDLSVYPVTRYYRAPEVLAEQSYQAPLDIWSLGCILAEMINRKVLFAGGSSEGAPILSLPQYMCIVNTIGSPKDEDILASASVSAILQSPPRVPRPPMATLCPGAAKHAPALDLLDRVLVHNPRERITADQILLHPFIATPFPPAEEPRLPGPLNLPNVPVDFAELQLLLKQELAAAAAAP